MLGQAVCIYKMLFSSWNTVNCPHFILEEADCWKAAVHGNLIAAVSHFRPWMEARIQVLLLLGECVIIESSPKTDTDRRYTRFTRNKYGTSKSINKHRQSYMLISVLGKHRFLRLEVQSVTHFALTTIEDFCPGFSWLFPLIAGCVSEPEVRIAKSSRWIQSLSQFLPCS